MKTQNQRGGMTGRTGLGVLLLALSWIPFHSVTATTITWTNTAGGEWHSADSWNGTSVPGTSDLGTFTNITGTFTVTLTNDVSSAVNFGQGVDNGLDVTFDLGGYTFTHSATLGQTILNVDREVVWRLVNGTFISGMALSIGYVNDLGWQSANVIIGTNAIFRAANYSTIYSVGRAYTGSLTLMDGGIMDLRAVPNTFQFIVGRFGTSSGTMLITGPNSTFYSGSSTVYVAEAPGSVGTVIVEQGGSMFFSNSVRVGRGGTGNMIVRDGGTVTALNKPSFTIGYYSNTTAVGTGYLLVTGATSRVNVGDISCGTSYGTGTVVIAGGGVIEAYRNISLGGSAATGLGNGTIRVTGTNSALRHVNPGAGQDGGPITFLGVGASTYATDDWDANGLLTKDGSVRGKGLLIAENGGNVDITGRIAVFSNSSVRVDGGRMYSKEIGMETGSVFQAVLRLGDANSATAMMTATNGLRIYGATLDVSLGSDFVYNYGDRYRLIQFGTFGGGGGATGYGFLDTLGNPLVDDDDIVVGGVTFDYAFDSLDPKYITLTAIPEPGSLGLIGAGIGLAALLRRRRG